MFEAGLRIEHVALVTGHRDWKKIKRYTNLRPEHLHRAGSQRPGTQPDVSETVYAAAQLLATQIQAACASHQAAARSSATPDVTPLLQRLTSLLLEHDWLGARPKPVPPNIPLTLYSS